MCRIRSAIRNSSFVIPFVILFFAAIGSGTATAASASCPDYTGQTMGGDSSEKWPRSGTSSFIGRFGSWVVARAGRNRGRVCFAHMNVTERLGARDGREHVYVQVATWPGRSSGYEFSAYVGRRFLENATTEIRIDAADPSFCLFNDGLTAWANTARDDAALIAAMASGHIMTIRTTAVDRSAVLDVYRLAGLADALTALRLACRSQLIGRPRDPGSRSAGPG